MAEISITVTDLHKDLDEQMRDVIGDQYEAELRNNVEDMIHETYQQLERQREQQEAAQEEAAVDMDEIDDNE